MIRQRKSTRIFGGICIWICTIFITYMIARLFRHTSQSLTKKDAKSRLPIGSSSLKMLDANLSLTFIGGMPRSGTTLMRTMLDAHPSIRCGQETHVIPLVLDKRQLWLDSADDKRFLTEAGVIPEALDKAMAQFILEIIIRHGPASEYYCNKDPYTLMYTSYLHQIFPNAKFILMLRDGRASAHSIITRKVNIAFFDITSYRNVLANWNTQISKMYIECLRVGPEICLPVYYEQLVLQPVKNTKKIFEFLAIPWVEAVLHHEQHINETKLSPIEFSTDQVKKPLYLDALSSWFGKIPPDVELDMPFLAPMLSVLGYDPKDRTPKYGEPDEFVLKKVRLVIASQK